MIQPIFVEIKSYQDEPMTVGQLVEQLQRADQDAVVELERLGCGCEGHIHEVWSDPKRPGFVTLTS